MKEFAYTQPVSSLTASSLAYLRKDMLMFDIETTGLSASRNRIYMVGLGYQEGNVLRVLQYLTESPDDEACVLDAVRRIVDTHDFHQLVTFNGTTFDLPFFVKRAALHIGESSSHLFSHLDHLDLYRALHPVHGLFPMDSYRQKDYEALLGVGREDQYDGGKLISVYHRFEKQKKQADCDLLCLHNKEDLFGLFHVLSLLSCLQIREGSYEIQSAMATSANELSVHFRPDVPLPISIRSLRTDGSLLMRKQEGLVVLPLHQGTLRYYLPDPQNYYYLTAEDKVVHKSVGRFVDPAFRRKAEPEECYSTLPVPVIYMDGAEHIASEDMFWQELRHVLDSFFSH